LTIELAFGTFKTYGKVVYFSYTRHINNTGEPHAGISNMALHEELGSFFFEL
jgi:hypothetical protein